MSQQGLFGDKVEHDKKPKKRRRATLDNVVSLVTGTTPNQDAQRAHELEVAENKVEELQHELQEIYAQLRSTRDYNPHLCAADLEYYGDQRLFGAWWWLLFDLAELDEYMDAPPVENYDIGATWRKMMNHVSTKPNEDTIRYVNDRAKWAEEYVLNELKEAANCYATARKNLSKIQIERLTPDP